MHMKPGTLVGPRNHLTDGSLDPHDRKALGVSSVVYMWVMIVTLQTFCMA